MTEEKAEYYSTPEPKSRMCLLLKEWWSNIKMTQREGSGLRLDKKYQDEVDRINAEITKIKARSDNNGCDIRYPGE